MESFKQGGNDTNSSDWRLTEIDPKAWSHLKAVQSRPKQIFNVKSLREIRISSAYYIFMTLEPSYR